MFTKDTIPSTDSATADISYSQWLEILTSLACGESLSEHQAYAAMNYLISAKVSNTQLAGFVMGISVNNITAETTTGILTALRQRFVPLTNFPVGIDIVGTGGDGLGTANISTMSAIVTASAGVRVLKHGGRSASSPTGSADLIESLGISLTPPVQTLRDTANTLGICFFFAPYFYPSLSILAPIRKELGIPTIFNVIGPLANPISDTSALIGCSSSKILHKYASILSSRSGIYILVRGYDGQDEVSTIGSSEILIVGAGKQLHHELDPQFYGFSLATLDQLRGGDKEHNTAICLSVLSGEKSAYRDAVIINAGVAIALGSFIPQTQIYHPGKDINNDAVLQQPKQHNPYLPSVADFSSAIGEGIERAQTAIDSGAALQLLAQWKMMTNNKME